jgi:hypothetical protein
MARYKQRQILPGITKTLSAAAKMEADGAITANDIIAVSGQSGTFMKAAPADADSAVHARSMLMVADFAVATGVIGSFAVPWKLLQNQNTAAATVGQTVFLSNTAGGISLTAGTLRVPVGIVTSSHASTGTILLAPSSFAGRVVAGTISISSDTTGAAAVGATLDGLPVTAVANTENASRYVRSAVWNGSGTLTITMNGTFTGTVSYMIAL